ncbi:hypothetical protein DBR42_21075 [Pelomonas sp. HMWF004]|nr:hypothetical protein DBR42_21075 [Pelomonas sp. HMWF004]
MLMKFIQRTPLTLLTAAVAVLAALAPLASQAQAAGDAEGAGDSRWGAGLLVMPEVKPYRGVDDKTVVWPMVTFENRWVRVFGPGLEVKLGRSGALSYGLTVAYAREGYEADDAAELAGMEERKASVWVGGRVNWQAGWASLSADWSGDAMGHSKGQKLRLGAERRFAVGEFGLTPRLTATWLDSKYVDYYYGVRAAEASVGRAAYTPGSTVNTELGLRVDYRLAAQQTVFADVGVTALGSAIKQSSLVDRSTVPTVRLGYLYRF